MFSHQQLLQIRQAAADEMANDLEFSPNFLYENQGLSFAIKEQSELHYGSKNQISAPTPEMIQKWFYEELDNDYKCAIHNEYMAALHNPDFLSAGAHYPKPDSTMTLFYTERKKQIAQAQQTNHPYQLQLDDFIMMQYFKRGIPSLLAQQWYLNLYALQFALGKKKGYEQLVFGYQLRLQPYQPPRRDYSFLVTNFGASYALHKFSKAWENLSKGDKIISSLARILAFFAGNIIGGFLGMAAAVILVSILLPNPVLLVAGSLAGIAAGMFAGAAIAINITKQLFRGLSWCWNSLFNQDAISKTNLAKYSLTPNQKTNAAITTEVIYSMLRDAKQHKPKSDGYLCYERENRLTEDYNNLIYALKERPQVAAKQYYLTRDNLFMWEQNHWQRIELKERSLPASFGRP
jgi:hypothetical protein